MWTQTYTQGKHHVEGEIWMMLIPSWKCRRMPKNYQKPEESVEEILLLSSRLEPTLLTPRSWTSNLWSCEKHLVCKTLVQQPLANEHSLLTPCTLSDFLPEALEP